jgi:hypothetical protein
MSLQMFQPGNIFDADMNFVDSTTAPTKNWVIFRKS